MADYSSAYTGAEIEALLDRVSEVVTSGSNSSGNWVKFNDTNKTMIQYGEETLSENYSLQNIFGSTSGTVYYYDSLVSFPLSFADTSYSIAVSGLSQDPVGVSTSVRHVANTSILAYHSLSGRTLEVSWIAIGTYA